MIKKFGLTICLIVLVVCLVGSGCTMNQNAQGPVQTIPPTVSTTSQTVSPTTPQVTMVSSMATTSMPEVTVTTSQTPADTGLIVTLNSAVKKTKIGSYEAKPGLIFLVLDLTLKNNDINNDFEYKDTSFTILDKTNNKKIEPNTNKISSGLDNPFTSGKIPLKSEKTGQVVFGVPANSTNYKFTLVDIKGNIITTIDTIDVP